MTSIVNQVSLYNRILQSSLNLILGLVIITGFGITTLAQAPERPDRGTRSTGAYSVTDIEAISLTNGNVNLSIPLASLPPMAGGELNWVLQSVYNSKLWDTTKTENQTPTIPPVKYVVTRPQLSDQGGGWRIGMGYDLMFQESRLDFDWITPASPDPDYPFLVSNPSWYKVIVTTPDGATHELRPTDHQPYSGIRDYLRGYYRQTPTTLSQTMRYYSVDGSYLWASVNPPGQTIRWTIYQKDGTRVVQYDNGIQDIIDSNSNSIRLSWGTDPGTGLSVRHITDLVTGREITYTFDPDGNGGNGQGLVRYQTVGGTWITITVNFGYTIVRGKIYQVDDANGCFHDEVLENTEVLVIRSIILPQTQPGVTPEQFTFNYRSDSTHQFSTQWRPACPGATQPITLTSSNGWGELSQMLLPKGSTVTYTYSFDSVDKTFFASDIPAIRITKKEVSHDGVTDDWDYTIGLTLGTVEGPDGSITTQSCPI